MNSISRRRFLQSAGLGAAAFAIGPSVRAAEKPIQGFEKTRDDPNRPKDGGPFQIGKFELE